MKDIRIVLVKNKVKGGPANAVLADESHNGKPTLVFRCPTGAEYANLTLGVYHCSLRDRPDAANVLTGVLQGLLDRIENAAKAPKLPYLTIFSIFAIGVLILEQSRIDEEEELFI
jgi:hypothetical protein